MYECIGEVKGGEEKKGEKKREYVIISLVQNAQDR